MLLEGQCEVGADDIGTDIIGVVLCHQSGGYVNRYDLCRRGVDVFYQGGESASQRLVEAGAEKSVDHQHAFFKTWRVELLCDFNEVLGTLRFDESFLVGGAFLGEMSTDIEEIGTHMVVEFAQHTGHCECVATIVAWSGKDNNGYGIVPSISDGARQCLGGTFHQIDAGYRLVFDGVSVKLFDLSTGEYFHCNCKNKKNILIHSYSLGKNL